MVQIIFLLQKQGIHANLAPHASHHHHCDLTWELFAQIEKASHAQAAAHKNWFTAFSSHSIKAHF